MSGPAHSSWLFRLMTSRTMRGDPQSSVGLPPAAFVAAVSRVGAFALLPPAEPVVLPLVVALPGLLAAFFAPLLSAVPPLWPGLA